MNRKLLKLSENEKNSILEMHKSATRNHYLTEQESPIPNDTEANQGQEKEAPKVEEKEFDCDKVKDMVSNNPDVKKWSDKILGSPQWTVRSGSHKLADQAIYVGVLDVIRIIQCIVGAEVDGKFGNETLTKLKEYQRGQNIKDDGIVGDITWCKMFPELCEDKSKDQDQSGNQGDGTQGDGTQGDQGDQKAQGDKNASFASECINNFGRASMDGEHLAGGTVTRVRIDKNDNTPEGKVITDDDYAEFFGFNPDGSGIMRVRDNGRWSEKGVEFRWSCDGGQVKFWQEVEF